MKNIIKWLQENNFKFEPITLTNGTEGILVDTNYNGPHPTRETFKTISIIENKVRRLKKLTTEARGHYTGLLIKEI